MHTDEDGVSHATKEEVDRLVAAMERLRRRQVFNAMRILLDRFEEWGIQPDMLADAFMYCTENPGQSLDVGEALDSARQERDVDGHSWSRTKAVSPSYASVTEAQLVSDYASMAGREAAEGHRARFIRDREAALTRIITAPVNRDVQAGELVFAGDLADGLVCHGCGGTGREHMDRACRVCGGYGRVPR